MTGFKPRVTRPGLLRIGAAVALAALMAPSANAVLGGDAASIPAGQARLGGERRQVLSIHPQVSMHEVVMADGSSIREYVSPSGIVFAVAWSTRYKPNLESLLGQHLATYTAAASDAMKTPGIKRNVLLRRDDLVVHSAAHLNSFVGKAYLQSLVPQGVSVNELR
jgi:hypothetical protein